MRSWTPRGSITSSRRSAPGSRRRCRATESDAGALFPASLLVGYFEGLDSERGIAWRAVDSLAVRGFLGLGLDAAALDHSTISRTRGLIDVDTHRAVFTWVQERLVDAKLLRGKTVAIDATTLEANAAMRSIVRRDTGGKVRGVPDTARRGVRHTRRARRWRALTASGRRRARTRTGRARPMRTVE